MPGSALESINYPSLSNLISVDDLPQILGFLKDDLTTLFSNIYYKDYLGSNNKNGSNAFFNLTIISKTKIQLDLLNTGIFFVLNPDFADDSISSFPISIFWNWEIIKFVNNFNLSTFSFSGQELFNLAINIFDLNQEEALIIAASIFVNPSTISITRLQQLVTDINALYSADLSVDDNEYDPFQDLINQLNALNKDVFTTIFELYVASDNANQIGQNITLFFKTVIPTDINDYIEGLIVPKAKVSLELSAALEFPRSLLLPMKVGTNSYVPDTSLDSSGNLVQTYIKFGDAILSIDTNTGFAYQTAFAGTLYPQFAQVGNTSMV